MHAILWFRLKKMYLITVVNTNFGLVYRIWVAESDHCLLCGGGRIIYFYVRQLLTTKTSAQGNICLSKFIGMPGIEWQNCHQGQTLAKKKLTKIMYANNVELPEEINS